MKKITYTLVAAAILKVNTLSADTTAIINAQIHKATNKGVITNGSVLIENGQIKQVSDQAIKADNVIDAKGKVLTPGFIGSMNQLGLVEVGAVATSRDGSEHEGGITFDPSLAFNPKSSLIPYARKGGITRYVIAPGWGDGPFVGLSSTVNLTGEFGSSVITSQNAIIVNLGGSSEGSRVSSLARFNKKLEEQHKKLTKSDTEEGDNTKPYEPEKEELLLMSAFKGEKPIVVRVSRAQDMIELIKLKEQFGVDLVFAGAEDARVIKEQLATAKISVILGAMDNLPGNFDSLNASLTTAGELEKAGVKVALTMTGDSTHNVYQL